MTCAGIAAIITGDLITDQHDPLDRCLLQLSRLKALVRHLGLYGQP